MPSLNVLIVEDESLVALELSNTIKSHKYNVVDYVTTPKDAQMVFQKEKIDLIIMDINLNDTIDGIELYKSLNTNTDIIYLTAYSDEKTLEMIVETVPLGYLVKPHNEKELLMLLKLAEVKKRGLPKGNRIIDIGHGYHFDVNEKRLYKGDTYVKLSKKELGLFELLLSARESIVTFTEIENELWDTPPSESSLRTLIYRLRGKLEHNFIKNELNHGIKLEFEKK